MDGMAEDASGEPASPLSNNSMVKCGLNKDKFMQERNDSAGDADEEDSPTNQVDVFARNMVRLFDQGAKVFSRCIL